MARRITLREVAAQAGVDLDHIAPVHAPPEQRSPPPTPTTPPPEPSVPAEGGRRAFAGLSRGVTAAELAEPGTQKLVLELLNDAETEAEQLKQEVTALRERSEQMQKDHHERFEQIVQRGAPG